MRRVRFRHSVGIVAAGVIAFVGSLPVAASSWYFAWLPLVPLLVLAWGIRSGTDADSDGITVRALLGTRRERWADIEQLHAPDGRHAVARLSNGMQLRLAAVSADDLPRLAAVTGHLDRADRSGEPGPAAGEPEEAAGEPEEAAGEPEEAAGEPEEAGEDEEDPEVGAGRHRPRGAG